MMIAAQLQQESFLTKIKICGSQTPDLLIPEYEVTYQGTEGLNIVPQLLLLFLRDTVLVEF